MNYKAVSLSYDAFPSIINRLGGSGYFAIGFRGEALPSPQCLLVSVHPVVCNVPVSSISILAIYFSSFKKIKFAFVSILKTAPRVETVVTNTDARHNCIPHQVINEWYNLQ